MNLTVKTSETTKRHIVVHRWNEWDWDRDPGGYGLCGTQFYFYDGEPAKTSPCLNCERALKKLHEELCEEPKP